MNNASRILTLLDGYLDYARFIAGRAGFSREDIRNMYRKARVPDVPEIREQFELCSSRFT